MRDGLTAQFLRDGRLRARNWALLARLVGKTGLGPFAHLARRFHWIPLALKIHRLLDHAPLDRSMMGEVVHLFFRYLSAVLETHLNRPERLVWYEELLTPEIPMAMGLTPFMTESLGLIFPLIDRDGNLPYVDRAENAGFPADMCSFVKTSLGLTLAGELPRPRVVLTTNSPCDSAMAGYLPIEKALGVPVFRLDHPYVANARSLDYYARGLWKMIRFLEQETPGRMDFDRLREICEERNRASEYLLEFRELMRSRPAPAGGLMLTLSIIGHQVLPGTPFTTRFCRQLRDVAIERVGKGQGRGGNEKLRIILWNPPVLIDGGLFPWMEREFGAVVVMDMLSYRAFSLIDTSSPESMVRGLAYDMMKGPMARHTRGPAANYCDDLLRLYREYGADMVLLASHQGCKNALALQGILRDLLRQHQAPLLDIQYDLVDPRITSPEQIRGQIADFMETVMAGRVAAGTAGTSLSA